MKCLGICMTNFDHSIDKGTEEALRSEPDGIYTGYAAANFFGYVWFDGEQFLCDVWRYHASLEIVTAPTLEELMTLVSDKYGYE